MKWNRMNTIFDVDSYGFAGHDRLCSLPKGGMQQRRFKDGEHSTKGYCGYRGW